MKTLVLAFFCLMLSGIAGAAPPSYIDGTDGGKVAALKTLGGGGTNFLGANYVTVPKQQTITDKTVAAPAQQGVPAYAAITWAVFDTSVRQPIAMGALVQPAGAQEIALSDYKMAASAFFYPGTVVGQQAFSNMSQTMASAPSEVSLSGAFDHLPPSLIVAEGGNRGYSSSDLS